MRQLIWWFLVTVVLCTAMAFAHKGCVVIMDKDEPERAPRTDWSGCWECNFPGPGGSCCRRLPNGFECIPYEEFWGREKE